jgi:hypothetical protein
MTSSLAPTSIARPRPHHQAAQAAGDEASCRRRSASTQIPSLLTLQSAPESRRRASEPLNGLLQLNAQGKDAPSNPSALARFPHSA